MAQAFKCERCGELKEGSPNHVDWGYTNSNGIGQSEKMEVCYNCRQKFLDTVEQVW